MCCGLSILVASKGILFPTFYLIISFFYMAIGCILTWKGKSALCLFEWNGSSESNQVVARGLNCLLALIFGEMLSDATSAASITLAVNSAFKDVHSPG